MGNIADHIAAAIAIPGSINDKLIGFFAGAVRYGAGAPEGVVPAPVGAVYHRSDGGAGTSIYVKETGSGNTGWKALVTAAASSGVTNKFLTNTTANPTNLTQTSKTVVAAGSTFDLTIPAVVNDVLEAGVSGAWGGDSVGGQGLLDMATMVSAAVVNWLGAAGTGFSGITGTLGRADTVNLYGFDATVRYTVVSGDISGGNVTLRLYYVVSGGSKRINISAQEPFQMWVKNLGPQSP